MKKSKPMKTTEHKKRVKAGRCVRCAKPNDGESVFCKGHRKANRDTVRWYRQAAAS